MKKNLLSVLILVLLLVNIALTTVMMISVTGTNKKTADLVTSIATVLNLELYKPGEESASEVSLADTETYVMTEMMIPLSASTIINEDGSTSVSSKQSYIMFTPSLLQNTGHEDYKTLGGAEKMAAADSLVKDIINSVVGSHTLEECQNDFEGIRAEILKEIQKFCGSDRIYKVAISAVKYN